MSNKILGPQTGYVDLFMYELEEAIALEHAKSKAFKRTPIRPSSAGKCARELYFEMMEYAGKAEYPTKPMEPETDLLLNLGHYIERHLIDKLRKNFTLAEVKYTQQFLDFGKIEAVNDNRLSQHLEGSMDLCFWSEKWKCAVDVKSKGDNYDFKKRQMKWETDTQKLLTMETVKKLSDRAFWVEDLVAFLEELKDPFFQANFRQLNMYLGSSFLRNRDINHGAIIQYHKAKSKLREVRFKFNEKLFDDTVKKFHNVVKAVDESNIELAPQEYTSDDFKTKYCQFCAAKVPGSCRMKGK